MFKVGACTVNGRRMGRRMTGDILKRSGNSHQALTQATEYHKGSGRTRVRLNRKRSLPSGIVNFVEGVGGTQGSLTLTLPPLDHFGPLLSVYQTMKISTLRSPLDAADLSKECQLEKQSRDMRNISLHMVQP